MLLKALMDNPFHNVVSDQVSGGDDSLNFGSELRMVLDVPAEDVAHADVNQIESTDQSRSLSSLATTLDTHDHVLVHDLLPPRSLGTSGEANEHWRALDADHQSSGMKV